MSSSPCPACGVPGSGAFCSSCGARRAGGTCPSCGLAAAPADRFCGRCGTAVGQEPARRAAAPTWAIALGGVAVLALALALAWRSSGPRPAPAAAPTATTAPAGAAAIDLSSMTPRERFDRLYDRVMRASEANDQATVTQFAPMALAAYAQLDTVDADARYHAAMIRMHTGDLAGAALLADSIRAADSVHLFSAVIHGTLARQRQDRARLAAEQQRFLRHYQSEMSAERPEYGMHTFILDQFVAEARAATP